MFIISFCVSLIIFFGIGIKVIRDLQAEKVTNEDNRTVSLQKLKSIPGLTKYHQNYLSGKIITFDELQEELIFIDRENVHKIKFEDILKSEIKVDDLTVSKKSASIGGALIGGALLGEAGAIIGGTSGTTKSQRVIRNITLCITTKSISNPLIKYDFFPNMPAWASIEAIEQKNATSMLSEAEKWQAIMSIIIDKSNK